MNGSSWNGCHIFIYTLPNPAFYLSSSSPFTEISHHLFLQHHSINLWISFISNSSLFSKKDIQSPVLHRLLKLHLMQFYSSPAHLHLSIFSASPDISSHHFPQLCNQPHFPIQITMLKSLLCFVLYPLIFLYYSLPYLYHICQKAQVSQPLFPPSKVSLKCRTWILLPFSSFCPRLF